MTRILFTFLLTALCALSFAAEDDFVLPPNEFKPIKELGEYSYYVHIFILYSLSSCPKSFTMNRVCVLSHLI